MLFSTDGLLDYRIFLDGGRISLGRRVLFDAAAGIDLPPQRRHIGYVFQDARLFPHLSVEGNLRFGLARVRDRAVRVPFDEVPPPPAPKPADVDAGS